MGATDIQSSTGSNRKLRVHPSPNGVVATFATFDPDRDHVATIDVHRAEVLAALDAVDKDRFEEVVRSRVDDIMNAKGQYWIAAGDHQRLLDERTNQDSAEVARVREHAQMLATKLAEAEATIERVRLALFELDTPGNYRLAEKQPFEFGLLEACKVVRDALDPKPAFELPTEVPARIEARPDWIPDDEDGTMTLHLWTDGKDLCWSTEDGDTGYTPDQVMDQFTGHRLLDGSE